VLPRLFDIDTCAVGKGGPCCVLLPGKRLAASRSMNAVPTRQMHEAYIVAAPVQSAAKDTAIKGD